MTEIFRPITHTDLADYFTFSREAHDDAYYETLYERDLIFDLGR